MQQPFFKLSPRLATLDKEVMEQVKEQFAKIDQITEYNQLKMLNAFIKNGVSESHFVASTGYGYGDRGREVIDLVAADAFGAEAAIVRHNFVSGTHALTVALFGLLRPGDTMLCVTGRPYDTLLCVIGINGDSDGSLKEFGIGYDDVALLPDGTVDYDGIEARLKKGGFNIVYIQRSRGYSLRPSLTVEDIEKITKLSKSICPNIPVVVDNCYGEFVQTREPCDVGADLIVGSLIKNVGGGIASTGGYIAGRADLVEKCSYRLTVAGAGSEIGATLGHSRELFMGLFNAPHLTGEAVKTAVYSACLLEKLGFAVSPHWDEVRGDIIQTLTLGTPERLVDFCRGLQKGMPVDAFLRPDPSAMPGYDCDIIMACGSFTLGATSELSADAPLREPYAAWLQGSLNFHSGKMGVILAVDSLLGDNA